MPHPLPTKYKKYNPSMLLQSSNLESDGEIEDNNPSWFVDDNQSMLSRMQLLVEEDSKRAAQKTTPEDPASSAFGNQMVSAQKDVHDMSMEDNMLLVDGNIGAVHQTTHKSANSPLRNIGDPVLLQEKDLAIAQNRDIKVPATFVDCVSFAPTKTRPAHSVGLNNDSSSNNDNESTKDPEQHDEEQKYEGDP
ncbi:hypothetical protein ACA910_020066 [Epithemia clementina (nom. ined.)]